ncbi:AMP-binding protein [Lentibacter algarum]|uniref:AMP-binding protein n=1 Tax=Lentibacter algarum TaxID=576131 RepID=UPI0020918159|nr:AMP-binding protein [Lentibacter algarum]
MALPNFEDLHDWSIRETGAFWSSAWDFCGLKGLQSEPHYEHSVDAMQARFFPNARLNVVETFLKNADDRNAITFIGEDGRHQRWRRARLKREVEQLSAALRREGVTKGDRVAGYAPNRPQTVAAMLATACIGAVWSSCAPDSGPDVVVTADCVVLDDDLIKHIKECIHKNASPRHVPALIVSVGEIPRTKSGKIAELAVRDVVNNQHIRDLSGLANPQALDNFANLPELLI